MVEGKFIEINGVEIWVDEFGTNWRKTKNGKYFKSCIYDNGTGCNEFVPTEGLADSLCSKHIPGVKMININGIEILVKNGINYRKTIYGSYRPSCMYGDGIACSTYASIAGERKFCNKHKTGNAPYIPETKIIDIEGIEIHVMDGLNYRKNYKGKLSRSCMYGDGTKCNKFVSVEGKKEFCSNHKLGNNTHIPEIKIIYIDNVEIHVKDGINYRKNNKGHFVPSCMYQNGTKCKHWASSKDVGGQFCKTHKFGTDPNSEERKKEIIDRKLLSREKRKEHAKKYNSTLIGDRTEKYVVKIFKQLQKKHKDIEKIKRIGQKGGKFDIKVKFMNDFYRGIQVKTLTKIRNNNYYFNIRSYEDDTLIVAVNKKRTRFVVAPFKKIKSKHNVVRFNFKNKKSVFRKYMFKNIKKFKKQLYKRSKISVIFNNKKNLSNTQLKEERSMLRLKKKSKQLGLTFKYNDTNRNLIDCFINNKKIQCKYTERVRNLIYACTMQKSKNSAPCKYHESDNIDFLILELGHKFKNNFYIIPKKALIKHGIMQTKTQKGSSAITIYPPNHPKSHWTKKYLNRFDLLK